VLRLGFSVNPANRARHFAPIGIPVTREVKAREILEFGLPVNKPREGLA
jgi:hypothetical protein